jgi:ParB family transcriptional regulator, chromosome partitioning protein
MYKDALDAKLFSSQRQMAAALNVPQSNLSMALALASLPDEIIQAFASPLELQYRWATVLSGALDKDTARVITTASELAKQNPRPSAKEVLAKLLFSDARKIQSEDRQLRAGGKVIGSLRRDPKGTVTLRLRAGVLSATDEKKLTDFVERLLG